MLVVALVAALLLLVLVRGTVEGNGAGRVVVVVVAGGCRLVGVGRTLDAYSVPDAVDVIRCVGTTLGVVEDEGKGARATSRTSIATSGGRGEYGSKRGGWGKEVVIRDRT